MHRGHGGSALPGKLSIVDGLKERLLANRGRCHQLKFLGYVVTPAGVCSDQDKSSDVVNIPTPKKKKQVQKLPLAMLLLATLGLSVFEYRRSVDSADEKRRIFDMERVTIESI